MDEKLTPHEFTGPMVNGERICRYCYGTPRECQFVFGPHCARAALAASPGGKDAR